MGYDVQRFKSKVYNEVICCICFGVLERPFEVVECGHLFCEDCLKKWLDHCVDAEPPSCPIDRLEINLDDVRPAPEFITNFIGKLIVECDFAEHGCIVTVPLSEFPYHRSKCPLNPMKPIACSRGCGVYLPPSQMVSHHCNMDLCQEAIIWNDIFETAKMITRKRNYEKYAKKHGYLSKGVKRLVSLLVEWLADPRFHEGDEGDEGGEHEQHHYKPVACH